MMTSCSRKPDRQSKVLRRADEACINWNDKPILNFVFLYQEILNVVQKLKGEAFDELTAPLLGCKNDIRTDYSPTNTSQRWLSS